MGDTKIEWTDKTWSPLRARVKPNAGDIARAKGYTSLVQVSERMAGHIGQHCEHVSHGCDHCYAETNNHRCLPANGTGLPYDRRSRDLIDSIVDEKILQKPLHWRKPQRIFVENQSDLFGEWVSDEAIDRVFAVMALCPQHTFQVLTKRPERMRRYLESHHAHGLTKFDDVRKWMSLTSSAVKPEADWPLQNVWLGVSVEDQKIADERIPLLLQTPAAVRFVSYEPALGPVDFEQFPLKTLDAGENPGVDWIIVGGESGPGARPFNIAWARNTVAQCRSAGVACFVKQLGANPQEIAYVNDATERERANWMCDGWTWIHEDPGSHWRKYLHLSDCKGGDWKEWPINLRVRDFPEVLA